MQETSGRQSGFSIIEALVAVVAIGMIGASGWFLYQHLKTSATTIGATSNPSQSTNQQPTMTPAGSTVAYLDIKEWGIKVPLSDAIEDGKYIPSASIVDSKGQPAAMWVTTTSVEAKGCDLSNTERDGGGAIGEIMRIEPGEQDGVTGELLSKEFPYGTTVGGYYYAYKSWATSNTCASAADQQAADVAFASAVNGHVKPLTGTESN